MTMALLRRRFESLQVLRITKEDIGECAQAEIIASSVRVSQDSTASFGAFQTRQMVDISGRAETIRHQKGCHRER